MNKCRQKMLEKKLMVGSPNWEKKHVNVSFLKSLYKQFGVRIFTNVDAYVVYYKKHCVRDRVYHKGKIKHTKGGKDPLIIHADGYVLGHLTDETFTQQVRSILCAAFCLGDYGLEKIKNGVYKFKKSGVPKTKRSYAVKKRRKSHYRYLGFNGGY